LHTVSVTTLQVRLTMGILILTHHPCIESDLTEISSFSTATKLCVSLFKKRDSKSTLLIIEYSPGAESTTMQGNSFLRARYSVNGRCPSLLCVTSIEQWKSFQQMQDVTMSCLISGRVCLLYDCSETPRITATRFIQLKKC